MADYVSKYSGSQIDGILDEAIELPSTSGVQGNAFLKCTAPSGIIRWVSEFNGINTLEAENSGHFLRYGSSCGYELHDVYLYSSSANYGQFLQCSNTGLKWATPTMSNEIDTTQASDGQFLKYSYNTGLIWDTPSVNAANSASAGQFLKYDEGNGVMWDDLPQNGPEINMDEGYNGAYLMCQAADSGKILAWGNPLPDASQAIPGQVLAVSSVGEWELMSPSEAQTLYDASSGN